MHVIGRVVGIAPVRMHLLGELRCVHGVASESDDAPAKVVLINGVPQNVPPEKR